MMIGGILFAEKAEAGKAIIEQCRAMRNPDPVSFGEYRGLKMELSFDTFSKEYRLTFRGVMTYEVKLGSDIHGNITRIDNRIERIEVDIVAEEKALVDIHTQLEAAKSEVNRPFPQEQEYNDKTARLKELNILLNMDEKDNTILDAEPDEGDIALSASRSALSLGR